MQNKFDICVLRWETVNLKFKRMKKVFMIMAVAIMCSPVFAQDETVSSGIEMILVDEVPGVLHVKVVSE
jgi:hypothetical protein